MVINQVVRKSILTATFLLLVGMVPWGQPNSSVALPMKPRLVRSCGHHQIGLLYLEACNRSHKRSLALASYILGHHGRQNKVKYETLDAELTPPGGIPIQDIKHDPELLDPLFSPYTSEDSGLQEPNLLWKEDGWKLQEMNHVYKEIYRRAPSTIQMCCTTGCTESDFRKFCFA